MRFGFIIPNNWGLEDPKDVVDIAVEAEQLGFHSVWVNHHVLHAGYILDRLGDRPYYDALTVLTYVAALTRDIRLGTSVLVLPYLNPISLAKTLATLDILCAGRLTLGVGVGMLRSESNALGSDFSRRGAYADESIEVMKELWTQETPSFDGSFYTFSGVKFSPKPLQKPYPPIFQAVSTSPASVEFAARNQIQVIAGGPTDIMGQAPQVIRRWREKMDEFGHEHAHLDPPMSKGIYVAPTMEEAESDAVGLMDFSSRILRSIGSGGSPIGMPMDKNGNLPNGYENWAGRQQERERRDDPGDAGLPPLRGTPEVVIQRLNQLQEQGINHIFGSFGFPGLPQEKVLRSIEMFATQVMPHFRGVPVSQGGR